KKRMRLMEQVTHGPATAAGETHELRGSRGGGCGGEKMASEPAQAPPIAGSTSSRHAAGPAPHTATSSSSGAAITASSAKQGGSVRVVLGVRGLWVEVSWRRRGVARRLLDAARCCMVPGVAADRCDIAFSSCAAAAATGDPDGGETFVTFAATYLGANGGGRTGATRVLLYGDDEEEEEGEGERERVKRGGDER
ncbi:hypothetical protein Vafri_5918, partial [Volvox africanus]